jgi:hypothetical protein
VTYTNPQAIRDAVAPDGNKTGTCAELTDTQLQGAINRAQAVVDSYTGTAFLDANVPPLLSGIALALGSYYGTLMYRKGLALETGHPVLLQYQDAQTLLTAIKGGQIKFEPDRPDTDSPPIRPKPSVINRLLPKGATAFTLDDASLRVVTGRHGYELDDDPNLPQDF